MELGVWRGLLRRAGAVVGMALLASPCLAQEQSGEPTPQVETAAVTVDAEASGEAKQSEQEFPVGEWVSLFDGESLKGWIPKIRYHELGENYGDTFRVEDGLLKVRYEPDSYPKFDERFGHLFYEKPFSHYRLRVEYRFVDDQCEGGPGWAIRNSGMMLHGEDPSLMTKDQDFPASIEFQLLGGTGQGTRSTGNLCTPGTNVVMDGKLFRPHCTQSSSKTYHGEQWVVAEVEMRGSGQVKHFINGNLVLEYDKPQLDGKDAHSKMLIDRQEDAKLLQGGTISLQSESHPIDFRKVEIMVLEAE